MKIIACFATSIDGKIAPSGASHYERFSSDADIEHLKSVRDKADAILMGGKTFRAWPKEHKRLKGGEPILHCILTSGTHLPDTLPPNAPLFTEGVLIPTIIFHERDVSNLDKIKYPNHIRWVHCPSIPSKPSQVERITSILEENGIKTLLVEGGSQIMSLFLDAKAIDELYLTMCPLLIGGKQAPSLLSQTPLQLPEFPRAEILSTQQTGDELFLHYKLSY